MALSGILVNAQATFQPGTAQLSYTINIADDVLGVVGSRGYTVDDPAVIAAVLQYVEQHLPAIEGQTGMPVTLPPAPADA